MPVILCGTKINRQDVGLSRRHGAALVRYQAAERLLSAVCVK